VGGEKGKGRKRGEVGGGLRRRTARSSFSSKVNERGKEEERTQTALDSLSQTPILSLSVLYEQ